MDNTFLVKLGLDVQEVAHGIHESNALIEGFTDQIKELGTKFAEAFAVKEIAEFTFEVSELAAKAHGVQQAFAQIPNSVALLAQMNEVTHETVSNLELMKEAIKAQNLQIPMEKLGTIMEFVHDRSLATGQSFQELSEKVLTGIGAKSPKAFRDLQVSTEELSKAIKESGSFLDGFLEVAERHLKNAPIIMDETGKAIEQNSKKWEDLKVKIGETVNSSGVLARVLNEVGQKTDIVASDNLSIYEKLATLILPAEYEHLAILTAKHREEQNLIKEKEKEASIQNTVNAALKSGNVEAYIKALDQNINKQEIINRIRQIQAQADNKEIFDLGTIEGIEGKIKELKEEQLKAHGSDIHLLEEEIKKLQEKEKLLKSGGRSGQLGKFDSQVNLDVKGSNQALKELSDAAELALHKTVPLEKSFENVQKGLQRISGGGGISPVVAGFKAMQNEMDKTNDKMKEVQRQHVQLAAVMGNSFGQALTSIEDFAKGLSQAAIQIINKLEEIAIANIIKDATESNTNPVIAVAAAAAGFSAIKGLFAKIGGSASGGGESLGVSGGHSLTRSGHELSPQQINIIGKMDGRDVKFLVDKQARLDTQRKG